MLRTTSFLLLLSPLYAREEVTREFQKSVTLRQGQKVQIEQSLGPVTVQASKSLDASIRATLRVSGPSKDEAQKYLDQIEVIVDNGAELKVRVKYPEAGGRRLFRGNNISYTSTLDITIPEASPVVVRNRFGAVDVTGVKARVEVYGGHGKITLRSTQGDHFLRNAFGEVEVASNTGSVNIDSHNGKVTVSEVTGMVEVHDRFGAVLIRKAGGQVKVTSGNGPVEAIEVGGPTVITNSFGRVTVTDAADSVTIENQNGDISATRVKSFARLKSSFGKIDLDTISKGADLNARNGSVTGTNIKGGVTAVSSFGGVRLQQVSGKLDVDTSNGAIEVTAMPGCDPITLSSRFGPIRLSLPADPNYDITASTTFGGIHSDFPLMVSGKLDAKSIQGKIGKGGCPMKLTTANGSIQLKR